MLLSFKVGFVLLGVVIGVAGLRPKQKGLVAGTIGVFQENSNEQMLLYYDFDRDQRVDILTKSLSRDSSHSQLNFYLWNRSDRQFIHAGHLNIPDYIVLKTALASSFAISQQFYLVLFLSNGYDQSSIEVRPFSCQDGQCFLGQILDIEEFQDVDHTIPTLISHKGNPCLLFQRQGQAHVLSFKSIGEYQVKKISDLIDNDKLPQPFGFSYSFNGDYDGDCQTDLVLLSESGGNSQLHFLRGDLHNTYSYHIKYVVPETVTHFTIHDINFDGKNDLMLLLSSGQLQIHYNTNTNSDKLCTGSDAPYDFAISSSTPKLIQRVPLGNKPTGSAVLLAGDFNNDGFQDLTVTLQNSDNSLSQAVLLQNSLCQAQNCGSYNPTFTREYSTRNIHTFIKRDIPNLPSVSLRLSFLDFLQDGNLDIIAEVQAVDDQGRYLTIQPIYNNIGYDAFFLTVNLMADRTEVVDLENTEFIGGSASFYVTLLSGELTPRTGNQLTQTGTALQLPFARFGLGRTNNYLQTLTIRLPRDISSKDISMLQFEWSPIIPNSDILILPPSEHPAGTMKQEWHLEIMIEPTEKMQLVGLFMLVTLGVMGVVIVRLNRKEVDQDHENQKIFYTIFG